MFSLKGCATHILAVSENIICSCSCLSLPCGANKASKINTFWSNFGFPSSHGKWLDIGSWDLGTGFHVSSWSVLFQSAYNHILIRLVATMALVASLYCYCLQTLIRLESIKQKASGGYAIHCSIGLIPTEDSDQSHAENVRVTSSGLISFVKAVARAGCFWSSACCARGVSMKPADGMQCSVATMILSLTE